MGAGVSEPDEEGARMQVRSGKTTPESLPTHGQDTPDCQLSRAGLQ